MNYRSILRTAAIALSSTSLTAPAMAQAPASSIPSLAGAAISTHAGERSVTSLDSGWRFHDGDAAADATATTFDDAGWEVVSVPHSWNRVGFYRNDPASHLHRANTVNKRQGVGWYRLRFTPTIEKGRRAWLEFDAASRIASVWLNGKKLGDHAGGFSRFRLDATGALRTNAENVLVVRTDNSAPSGDNAATADVLPLTGDFFVHGGLYRPVRLVVTDPVHIDLSDWGGPGIYATTEAASATAARIAVRARVTNDAKRRSSVRLIASLVNAEGRTTATTQAAVALTPGATQVAAVTLDLANPRLWQGTEDPYLYSLVVDVLDARGRLLDRVRQPFGVRTIRIDPDQGLFLNGRHIQLRGDLLPRIHAIGKLARQMETSDAAKPIYRGSDHWGAAGA